jgi:hypothetical protein
MLKRLEAIIQRAVGNAIPDWTLLAISLLVSAVVVMALRSIFD